MGFFSLYLFNTFTSARAWVFIFQKSMVLYAHISMREHEREYDWIEQGVGLKNFFFLKRWREKRLRTGYADYSFTSYNSKGVYEIKW